MGRNSTFVLMHWINITEIQSSDCYIIWWFSGWSIIFPLSWVSRSILGSSCFSCCSGYCYERRFWVACEVSTCILFYTTELNTKVFALVKMSWYFISFLFWSSINYITLVFFIMMLWTFAAKKKNINILTSYFQTEND